ncbi:MAG: hypothetical protein WAU68_14675 [Vitreimonas sp.]
MDGVFAVVGVIGATCAVGVYAAVSIGKISADTRLFYLINGIGSTLVLIAASRQFDPGDFGTICQECIWTAISVLGFYRAATRKPKATPEPMVTPLPPVIARAVFGLKKTERYGASTLPLQKARRLRAA